MSQGGDFDTGPGPIDSRGGSGSGTFRAVAIVLVALGGAFVLVCAGGVFWVMQNEAVREGFTALTEAADAPGAEALREAGCEQAMIVDSAVFLRVAAGMAEALGEEDPALTDGEASELMPAVFAICTFAGSPTLGCADVARIYREETGSAELMVAQVSQGTGVDSCQEVFDGEGNALGEFDAWVEAQAEAGVPPQ